MYMYKWDFFAILIFFGNIYLLALIDINSSQSNIFPFAKGKNCFINIFAISSFAIIEEITSTQNSYFFKA